MNGSQNRFGTRLNTTGQDVPAPIILTKGSNNELYDDNRIRQERTQKSLAAYEKYVEKNGEPTDQDMRKLFGRFDELAKKGPGLYWWAVKVYNGWCIVNKKSTIWN